VVKDVCVSIKARYNLKVKPDLVGA